MFWVSMGGGGARVLVVEAAAMVEGVNCKSDFTMISDDDGGEMPKMTT